MTTFVVAFALLTCVLVGTAPSSRSGGDSRDP